MPANVVGRDRETQARALLRTIERALPDRASVALSLGDRDNAPRAPDDLGDVRARVVFAGADAVGRLLWPPTSTNLAEAYLRGDLEILGDISAAIEAGEGFDAGRLDWADRRRLVRGMVRLRRHAAPIPPLRRSARLHGRRHSEARDLEAVRFHYDVGNEFFSLWLDRRMVYSCACFDDEAAPAESLDAAQEAKLDLICRKLRLAPGARLLDIGCGWGGLVLFAAEHYGVEAVGVTLSERQAAHARAAAAQAGLVDRVRFEVRDYRELAPRGTFDAIASVGMFEHVGREMLPTYFRSAFEALRPGGLFLNHGIAGGGPGRRNSLRFRPRAGNFVGRYVFPDGELVPAHEALEIAGRAGFEGLDLHSLRPHYALTLAAWVRRLEEHELEARRLAGEEVFRTWRLYMAAARRGFERGDLDVVQLLLARPTATGPATLPLRPWW